MEERGATLATVCPEVCTTLTSGLSVDVVNLLFAPQHMLTLDEEGSTPETVGGWGVPDSLLESALLGHVTGFKFFEDASLNFMTTRHKSLEPSGNQHPTH